MKRMHFKVELTFTANGTYFIVFGLDSNIVQYFQK